MVGIDLAVTRNLFENKDDEILAAIEAALANPIMQPVADYLEFSRIGLKAGQRTTVETDIPDLKEENGKATYVSRDYAGHGRNGAGFSEEISAQPKTRSGSFCRCAFGPGAFASLCVHGWRVLRREAARATRSLTSVQKSYPAGSVRSQARAGSFG